MGTRFQGDVRDGPTGVVGGGRQSDDLRVRTTGAFVPSLAHDLVLAHEDAADDRVRRRRAAPTPRQLAGTTKIRVAHRCA